MSLLAIGDCFCAEDGRAKATRAAIRTAAEIVVLTVLFPSYSAGLGEDDCRPAAVNVTVFTSPSVPRAGIGWPFQLTCSPPALPALTTSSFCAPNDFAWVARSVSEKTWAPSAVIVNHESSVACTCTVNKGAGAVSLDVVVADVPDGSELDDWLTSVSLGCATLATGTV